MTFDAEETSVESGQPVELYEFIIGSDTYRYTSSEDTVTYNTQSWLPRQIRRNSPKQSTEERRQQLEVSIPTEDPVASRFIGIVPGKLMTLTITRVHRGDLTDGFVLWVGRITGAAFKKNGAECTLQGLTTEAAFSRPIPRFKYQGTCNHVLFDAGCKVTKASFKYTGTVGAVSGNTITINGLTAAKGAQWAKGGYIDFGGDDYRLIKAQPDDVCTILLPFYEENMVGQNVDVYAGCAHTLAVCNSKFNNTVNFGGFPYVPTKNPFTTRL